MSSLPQVGSAFPAPTTKPAATTQLSPAAVTNGKFADFVGRYDGGTMGVLVVREEQEKLYAIAPSGERIELVPEAAADKFVGQPIGAPVTFERDASNRIVAIVVSLPKGRQEKGKKIQ